MGGFELLSYFRGKKEWEDRAIGVIVDLEERVKGEEWLKLGCGIKEIGVVCFLCGVGKGGCLGMVGGVNGLWGVEIMVLMGMLGSCWCVRWLFFMMSV